jgi:hypothetical protein
LAICAGFSANSARSCRSSHYVEEKIPVSFSFPNNLNKADFFLRDPSGLHFPVYAVPNRLSVDMLVHV